MLGDPKYKVWHRFGTRIELTVIDSEGNLRATCAPIAQTGGRLGSAILAAHGHPHMKHTRSW
eukprot:3225653-Alexandrium_andersonii.AAC.1